MTDRFHFRFPVSSLVLCSNQRLEYLGGVGVQKVPSLYCTLIGQRHRPQPVRITRQGLGGFAVAHVISIVDS